jgi:hypothetical protein
VGKWGNGEMGKWGNGEMGRINKNNLLSPESESPESESPTSRKNFFSKC